MRKSLQVCSWGILATISVGSLAPALPPSRPMVYGVVALQVAVSEVVLSTAAASTPVEPKLRVGALTLQVAE